MYSKSLPSHPTNKMVYLSCMCIKRKQVKKKTRVSIQTRKQVKEQERKYGRN